MFGISTLYVKHVDLVAAADVSAPAPVDAATKPTYTVKPEVAAVAEMIREDAAQGRTVEAGRANRRANPAMKEAMAKAGLVTEPVFQTTADAIEPSARMKLFTKTFDAITRVMEFDRRWKNGTGYFDGIINNPDACLMMNLSDAEPTEDAERFMKPGDMAKCMDDHGRRLIIVATRLGPVVVFERYNDGKSDAITFNAPFELTNTILAGFSGQLDEDKLWRILGDGYSNNLGVILEDMFKHLNQSTKTFFEDATIEETGSTMASVVAEQAAVHH